MGDVFKRCIKCLFIEIAKMFISRCIGFLAVVSIFGAAVLVSAVQGPGPRGSKGQGDQGHKGKAQEGPRDGARGGRAQGRVRPIIPSAIAIIAAVIGFSSCYIVF